MDRMNVRLATPMDVLGIGALIEDYYRRRNAPPQYRELGTWYVVEGSNEQIVCAQNWADTGTGERWLLDTYCYDTRVGRLALGVMTRYAHDRADDDRVALLGVSELDNVAVGDALKARGWTDIGILRRREPGAQRQKRSA